MCDLGVREFLLKPYFWWKNRKQRQHKASLARVMRETGCDEHDIGGGGLAPEKVKLFVKKLGTQATRQDYGKFMKHGHQASWYRKSVKAKVQPEEED